MKAFGPSALILALICTAIPAWAESSGSDFEHEEELLQSAQGTLLRVRIAPTMDILEQRLASSLQSVDITSHASSRTLRTLSSGETKVASRANGPVIFEVPLDGLTDGLHTVGIQLEVANGNAMKQVGGFPVFLRVEAGRAELMDLNAWGQAHSRATGPCKGALCFQRPDVVVEDGGEE